MDGGQLLLRGPGLRARDVLHDAGGKARILHPAADQTGAGDAVRRSHRPVGQGGEVEAADRAGRRARRDLRQQPA